MVLNWEKVESGWDIISYIAQHSHGMFEIIFESNKISLYNNKCVICECKDVEDGKQKAEEYYITTYPEKEKKMTSKCEFTEDELLTVAESLRLAGEHDLAKKFHKNEVSASCSEGKDEEYCRFCTAGNGGKYSVCLTMDEDDGKTDEQYEAAAIAAFKILYPEEC